MDIDEFLDKETQAKIEDKKEKPIDIPESKEEEEAVKHYFELWGKVSETKFKWNQGLYAELNKESNNIKEKLGKLLPAMERKKSAIKRLIGKALSEIDNKDYESATKLYSEINNMRNSFPDFLLEQKKELNREIFLLYEKLHDQIDSKFVNDLKDSIAKIGALITNSYSDFDNGDADNAKVSYEKAMELYNGLPNGFLSLKMEIGPRLLELYKDLSIHTEIKTLQQQLAKRFVEGQGYTKSYEKLENLSEMVKNRNVGETKVPSFSNPSRVPERKYTAQEKTLLSRLISRKMDRAKINMEKGLYFEAKKNLESVLSVDPENEDAKQMLREVPVEY